MSRDRATRADLANDIAFELESRYGSCPQCVLAAVDEVLGGIDDGLFKASHPLAGGAAISGQGTCGALSGGILALGTRYGRPRDRFDARNMLSYERAKALYDRFVEEYGGPTCREVQERIFGRSFDLWDAVDHDAFIEMGGHDDKCPSVAGNVARWVVEILEGPGTP